MDRRTALQSVALTTMAALLPFREAALSAEPSRVFTPLAGPRSRVLYLNDLGGDLDGLYATVHMILSRSVDLRGIVGTSRGRPGEGADRAAALANEILQLMGRAGGIKVHVGAADKLGAAGVPAHAPGVQAIIDEALRTDTDLPLYVTVGGGLTEVASAVIAEPRIAGRFTLIWIGGDAWPDGGTGETNFNIDPLAAQYLFNETTVPIWQVPRAAYGTSAVSATELQAYVAPHGAIGAWLYRKVVDAPLRFAKVMNMGETWSLGDNPLVLLVALGDWGPSALHPFRYEHTSSSLFDEVTAPRLNPDGTFTPRSEGRKIRIYRTIDTRLMLGDFFAKLRVNFPAEAG